jgi:hypothetical protein
MIAASVYCSRGVRQRLRQLPDPIGKAPWHRRRDANLRLVAGHAARPSAAQKMYLSLHKNETKQRLVG